MEWLDTETKEILQRIPDSKLAPSKVSEFSLVLLQSEMNHRQLVGAVCRINDCSESDARKLLGPLPPIIINPDLSEEEALQGQFELICCDAISIYLRSEILAQNDSDYIQALFKQVAASPEFERRKVEIREIPDNESAQKFIDQFLGPLTASQSRPVSQLSILVPFKKARIMSHWASRIGAKVLARFPRE